MANNNDFEARKLCLEANLRVKIGGTLYINSKWIIFKEQSNGSGRSLGGAVLGEEVIWLGAFPFNPAIQKVRFTVKRRTLTYNPPVGTVIEGYTHGSNLSVCKPIMELYSKNPTEKISSEAFYSSGLAMKG